MIFDKQVQDELFRRMDSVIEKKVQEKFNVILEIEIRNAVKAELEKMIVRMGENIKNG